MMSARIAAAATVLFALALVTGGAAGCGQAAAPKKKPAPKGVAPGGGTSGTTPSRSTSPSTSSGGTTETKPETERTETAPSGPEPPAGTVAALERKYTLAKAAFDRFKADKTKASWDKAMELFIEAHEIGDKLAESGKGGETVPAYLVDINECMSVLRDLKPE